MRRIVLLVSFLVLVIVLSYYASFLQPSSTLDSFWPIGHPFRSYEEIVLSGFSGETSQTPSINYINGLQAPFRYGYNYANDDDSGIPLYDATFDLTNSSVQVYLTQQCDLVRSQLVWNAALYSSQQSSCPLNDFRDWILAKGLAFPLQNKDEFQTRLLEFILLPQYFSLGYQIGFERVLNTSKVRPNFYFNHFGTTRNYGLDGHDDRVKLFQAWGEFNASQNAPQALGTAGSRLPMDPSYFVWMETQTVFIDSVGTSIGVCICFAFIIVLVMSAGDFVVATTAMLCLGSSVSCTLGVMHLAGWQLGAVEAVASTILCGVAVDYNIYLAVTFANTDKALGRYDRVERTLQIVGLSVLFGGMTTFVSNSFLLLCTITLLNRFGEIMLIIICFGLVFAFLPQMAILSFDFPNCSPCFRCNGGRPLPTSMQKVNRWGGVYLSFLSILALIVLVIGLTYTTPVFPPSPTTVIANLPTLPKLSSSTSTFAQVQMNQWTEITLPQGLGAGCASLGSTYSFMVYKSSISTSSNVVVEMEGRMNGFCFSSSSCTSGTFSTTLDRRRFQRINAGYDSYPVLGPSKWTVFLPYCTADGFLGNVTKQYSSLLTMQHLGETNARLVLQWIVPQLTIENLILMGIGAGAVGALGHGTWLKPLLPPLVTLNVVVDSMCIIQAFQFFGSTVWQSNTVGNLDFALANNTLDLGRLLVASSAYDWFQTSMNQLHNNNGSLFKLLVENTPQVFPYLLRTNGDSPSAVLNPLGDRFVTDSHVTRVVQYMFQQLPSVTTQDLYFKCLDQDCAFDADLRGR